MKEMPESDLPKNVMNVPEVFHYIVDHHIEKGRKGRGEEVEKGSGRGRNWERREGGESTYTLCGHNVSLSLQ